MASGGGHTFTTFCHQVFRQEKARTTSSQSVDFILATTLFDIALDPYTFSFGGIYWARLLQNVGGQASLGLKDVRVECGWWTFK